MFTGGSGSRSHKSVALGQEERDSYTIRITGEDIENFQQTSLVIPEDDTDLLSTRQLDFTVSRLSAIESDLDEENKPVEIATDGDSSIAASANWIWFSELGYSVVVVRRSLR